MDQYHNPHAKKVSAGTGGRRRKSRDKKLCHIGGTFTATKVAGKDVRIKRRVRGGKATLRLKKAISINVVTKDGIKKAKVTKVLESPNPEHVRMNIITRGAILETDAGKVRVTNRVGQDGIINGILLR